MVFVADGEYGFDRQYSLKAEESLNNGLEIPALTARGYEQTNFGDKWIAGGRIAPSRKGGDSGNFHSFSVSVRVS
jgi:hypothetical protein